MISFLIASSPGELRAEVITISDYPQTERMLNATIELMRLNRPDVFCYTGQTESQQDRILFEALAADYPMLKLIADDDASPPRDPKRVY